MRWLLPLLASCATHDALHSEPVVARAACRQETVGVFGYPLDQQACGARITNLGDGCYVVVQPPSTEPMLYECAADTPDGHVACAWDLLGRDAWAGYGDPVRLVVGMDVPYEGAFRRTMGRCRARQHAWNVAHGVKYERAQMLLGEIRALPAHGIGPGTVLVDDRMTLDTDEDDWGLARILDGRAHLYASACPHGVINLEPGIPARLAYALRTRLATRLALADVEPARCERISVEVTGPRQMKEMAFAR